jgi:hypothetical protein
MPQKCGETPHKPRIPTSPIPQLTSVLQRVRHDALRVQRGSHQYILKLLARCCIVDLGLERSVERAWLMRVRDHHIIEEGKVRVPSGRDISPCFVKKGVLITPVITYPYQYFQLSY